MRIASLSAAFAVIAAPAALERWAVTPLALKATP
jgi:hypothetical protein